PPPPQKAAAVAYRRPISPDLCPIRRCALGRVREHVRRRAAVDLAEEPGEVARVLEPDGAGDLGDGPGALLEEVRRAFEPHHPDEPDRREAGQRAEPPVELAAAEVDLAGEPLDAEGGVADVLFDDRADPVEEDG